MLKCMLKRWRSLTKQVLILALLTEPILQKPILAVIKQLWISAQVGEVAQWAFSFLSASWMIRADFQV